MCIRFACQICVSSHILSPIVNLIKSRYARKRSLTLSFQKRICATNTLVLAAFRHCTSKRFLAYWIHLKYQYNTANKIKWLKLTSARAFSRSRRGTLRTSWLATLLRRCRGRVCHARCVEIELQVDLWATAHHKLSLMNLPGGLHSRMHCIDFECAGLPKINLHN